MDMLLHFHLEDDLKKTVTDMIGKMNPEDMEKLILHNINPKDEYDSFQKNNEVIRNFKTYHDSYYAEKNKYK